MRPDKTGSHRSQYAHNRKRILKMENICGICGKPVDKSLKPPDPMAPVVDHIIPVSKGGHPSDIANLQLAHNCCNRQKSDKIYKDKLDVSIGNHHLKQSVDWVRYRG